MELIEVFQILGIEQTKDERALKNAYRDRLAVTNPEDDPEGFKRLRAAYEEACRYARTPDAQENEETEQTLEDDTPAGQWVCEVRKIYENITDRCDERKWKALFEADAFLSLEEEENCTVYLLRFLMEHFKLPTDIWKLLNEKIHIVQNAGTLRERFPAQFVSYMVHKCESGEEVDFSEFQGAEDADYDQFLQYYDRAYQALQEAEQMIGCGDALHITHPVMEVCRASLCEKKGQAGEAIAHLKELCTRYPEDDLIAYNTAEMLWRNEGRAEAAAIYENLREKLPKHYMANLRLTDWYYEQGNYKEAKKCAEEILSVGGDDAFLETLQKINAELEREMEREYAESQDPGLGLDLGWCYLQDGRTDLGIRTVTALAEKVPVDRKEEYLGLMTKLSAEAAEYEKTITLAARWEESLEKKILRDTDPTEEEKDRDRIRQSHMIRMQCYRAYGYVQPEKFAQAIAEAEKAENGTPKDIGMLIEKAQIFVEMEEYERCGEISQRLIGDYQVYAAYANELEAAKRQWNAAGVIQNGRACLSYFPTYVKAYEMMAKVYLDLAHPDELKALLQQAKDNNVKSVILDAYEWQLTNTGLPQEQMNDAIEKFRKEYLSRVEAGQTQFYRKGLSLITEYLYAYPCEFLLVERGDFHNAAGCLEAAKEDYEKALSINPANPFAWRGLAQIHRYRGEYNEAMICLRKTEFFYSKGGTEKNRWPELVAEQAEVYFLLGNTEQAEDFYREYRDVTGTAGERDRERMKAFARCLACNDKTTEALKVLEKAFVNVLDATGEKLDLCVWCGEKTIAGNLLASWPEKIELIGKNTGNTQEYFEEYLFHLGWYGLVFGSGKVAIKNMDKALDGHKEDLSKKDAMADLILACILYGDKKKGAEYAKALKACMDREDKSGENVYLKWPKMRIVHEYLAGYYTSTEEEQDTLLSLDADCSFCHYCVHPVCEELEMVRILQLLKKGQEKEALERLEAQMQGHPGMGLQAIWHRYHSAQEQEGTGQRTKDTDPAVAAFHKEKPQKKRGFWQRLFGKKQ